MIFLAILGGIILGIVLIIAVWILIVLISNWFEDDGL